jgi:hypothetical protein
LKGLPKAENKQVVHKIEMNEIESRIGDARDSQTAYEQVNSNESSTEH